jgi:hypothetical protein
VVCASAGGRGVVGGGWGEGSGGFFQGDPVAEGFELRDEAAGFAFGVLAAGEVVFAELVVELSGGQDMSDDHQDGVGDHDDRFLLGELAAVAAPFHDVPVVEGLEVAGMADCCPGAFHQDGLEVLVAFPPLPERCFPADSWLPGHIPADDARCAASGKNSRMSGGLRSPGRRGSGMKPVMWVPMSAAERERFLADVHLGVLSVTVGTAGHTLAVPVWYSYQPGGLLTVLTGRRSRKAAAIRAAARFGLCVQHDSPPYCYVSVEGPVVSEEEPDPAERLAMARRYLGTAGGDRYIAENPDPGHENVAFRMRPQRWLSQDQGKEQVTR